LAAGRADPDHHSSRPVLAMRETLQERRARFADEGAEAWAEYQARQNAINANTERLRAERLAREAEEPKATLRKRRKNVRTRTASVLHAGSKI